MIGDSPRSRWLGHLLFWPPFAIWTWLLVEPNPVPEEVTQLLTGLDIAHYFAAKTLHVLGYTYLTVTLGIWVPRRRIPLYLAFTLILAHGLGSEIAQTFVPNRTGRPLDVLIDWSGITLGLFLGWPWWKPLFWRPSGIQSPHVH